MKIRHFNDLSKIQSSLEIASYVALNYQENETCKIEIIFFVKRGGVCQIQKNIH